MTAKLYNVLLIGYIGAMVYIVTEPWHDEIGDALVDSYTYTYSTWLRGKFYLEAKVDTILITEGM